MRSMTSLDKMSNLLSVTVGILDLDGSTLEHGNRGHSSAVDSDHLHRR